MKNYIIYARKSSTSEDRQAMSIDSQIDVLSTYAANNQLMIQEIYTESQSARTEGRPVFLKMVKYLKRSTPKGILCWNLDRLTRNFQDAATMSHMLQNGIITEIRTPSRVYGSSSTDLFLSGLDFLIAKKYSDDLSENVKRGMTTKVKMGWMPGRAPIGYINEYKTKGQNRIFPDPKRFDILRRIWDLKLSGEYSVPEIIDIINNKWGLKTRRTKRMGGGPLSKSALHTIFNNPFYYGHFLYNGELFEGKHKPMITYNEFETVRNMFQKPMKVGKQKHFFKYRGFMICGQCGSSITATQKIKLVKSTNKMKKYRYYHCTKGKDKSCKQPHIKEEVIDSKIQLFLKRIRVDENNLTTLGDNIDSIRQAYNLEDKKKIEELKEQLKKCDNKISNLLDFKLSPNNESGVLITDEEFIGKKNNLLKLKAKYQFELVRLKSRQEDITKEIKEVLDFGKTAYYRFKKGNDFEKRKIFSFLGSDHIVCDRNIFISMSKPIKEILVYGIGDWTNLELSNHFS